MGVAGSADKSTPGSSPVAHIFDVVAGDLGDEEIVKNLINSVIEDSDGKKVSVLPFDPLKCSREEPWLTISQADEVTGPLHIVSQMRNDELTESLESKMHQFVVDFVTVANPIYGRFGVLSVDYMLE